MVLCGLYLHNLHLRRIIRAVGRGMNVPKTVRFSLAELPASNIPIASLTMSPLRVPDPFPTVDHYSIVHTAFNGS
jgi:hypothetical protein